MSFLSPAKTATLTIKMLRFLFIVSAIRLAGRLHESTYVEQVLGKNKRPPKLDGLVLSLGVLLLLFHVAMLAIVNTMVGAGAFPKSVRSYALTESAAYMLYIMLVAFYMASLVQGKEYFNYKKDGTRAIRAYTKLMVWSVFPISVSPIFFTT